MRFVAVNSFGLGCSVDLGKLGIFVGVPGDLQNLSPCIVNLLRVCTRRLDDMLDDCEGHIGSTIFPRSLLWVFRLLGQNGILPYLIFVFLFVIGWPLLV